MNRIEDERKRATTSEGGREQMNRVDNEQQTKEGERERKSGVENEQQTSKG